MQTGLLLPSRADAILYCSHLGTSQENCGDALSAQGLAHVLNLPNIRIASLPHDSIDPLATVVYGGGGMIRPNFATREVFRDAQSRFGKTMYAIYGVGFNRDADEPEVTTADKKALRLWLCNASSVTVRDAMTASFLREKLNIACRVAPCPSFALVRKASDRSQKHTCIGIVPSFGHTAWYQQRVQEVIRIIDRLLEQHGAEHVLLICHDAADAYYARRRYPEARLLEPWCAEEIARAYGQCHTIVSFRGHGIIFAAALGIRCVPFPMNVKMHGLYAYHYGMFLSNKFEDAEREASSLSSAEIVS